MKVKYFTAGLLTAMLVIVATGANSTEPDIKPFEYAKALQTVDGNYVMVDTVNRTPITTFDPFTNRYGEGLSNQINMLKYAGENGWELISIDDSGNCYFKRQK
jgi:hypothetical protein